MSAFASALARSSGGATSAVFTVGATSFSSWFQRPIEMAALARLRAGSLYDPFTLNENELLLGHSTARPDDVPPEMSTARSGLSNRTNGVLLSYQEPVYPTLSRPFAFANSSRPFRSVVRSSTGTPISTAGLRPGDGPNPNACRLCPFRVVFFRLNLKSTSRLNE